MIPSHSVLIEQKAEEWRKSTCHEGIGADIGGEMTFTNQC